MSWEKDTTTTQCIFSQKYYNKNSWHWMRLIVVGGSTGSWFTILANNLFASSYYITKLTIVPLRLTQGRKNSKEILLEWWRRDIITKNWKLNWILGVKHNFYKYEYWNWKDPVTYLRKFDYFSVSFMNHTLGT